MSTKSSQQLELGGMPRVDLLPASTREALRRRPIVRRLIRGLVALTVVVALAIAGSVYLALTAQAELRAENDRTVALLAQQAEFAEAQSIDATLDEITASRQVAMTAEIDWEALLDEIRATLPSGVSLVSIDGELTSRAAFGAYASEFSGQLGAEPEPLRRNSIGSFRITASSTTVPDVKAWLEDLESITGFAGIAPPVSVISLDVGTYTVTIEVLLDERAYLGRFATEPAPTENEG
jgi:hypothetical protein